MADCYNHRNGYQLRGFTSKITSLLLQITRIPTTCTLSDILSFITYAFRDVSFHKTPAGFHTKDGCIYIFVVCFISVLPVTTSFSTQHVIPTFLWRFLQLIAFDLPYIENGKSLAREGSICFSSVFAICRPRYTLEVKSKLQLTDLSFCLDGIHPACFLTDHT